MEELKKKVRILSPDDSLSMPTLCVMCLTDVQIDIRPSSILHQVKTSLIHLEYFRVVSDSIVVYNGQSEHGIVAVQITGAVEDA